MLRSYRELNVWQAGIELVTECYRLTSRFPQEERFALSQQARRAAVSVPANIAEGYARVHRGDYVHHLSFACGSLAGLETHFVIAHRLDYISAARALAMDRRCGEVSRMLHAMRRRLEE